MRPYGEYIKEEILASFNALAAKEPISKITVGQICEGAQTTRTTFYRYFRDKYDVMNFNYRRMLDRAVSEGTKFRELCAYMFETYRDEMGDLPRVLRTEGADAFLGFVREYLGEAFGAMLEEGAPGILDDEVRAFQKDVIVAGSAAVSKGWAEGRYSLTPQQIADAIFEIAPATMQNALMKRDEDRHRVAGGRPIDQSKKGPTNPASSSFNFLGERPTPAAAR